MANERCPLCATGNPILFHTDARRPYFRCKNCRLVFVPPAFFLSPEAEKAEYDLHRNSPDDPGYRRFLGRLAEPLMARLTPARQGLDFGCGPGPTLSIMLQEAGHSVSLYDPFYAPDATVLEGAYEFITATEVLEHLRRPAADLERLWSCLKPGGILGIMTQSVINAEAFVKWRYITDGTHVCFYSRETFLWLALKWSARIWFIDKDVTLFLRNPGSQGAENAIARGRELDQTRGTGTTKES